MSRYGLMLGEVAPRGASVALTWAGAIPYFARRPAVDLLGKSDPVIARSPRKPIPFTPGHDKWDYDYSLGRLRPALIAQLWTPEPGLRERLGAWGYALVAAQPMAGGNAAQLLAGRSIPRATREELRRRLPGIVSGG